MSTLATIPEQEQDAVEMRRASGIIGYVPRWNIQTNLPHSDPGLVDVWTRVNGTSRLTIQPLIEEVESSGFSHTVVATASSRGPQVITKRRTSDGKLVTQIHHGIPYGPLPRIITAYIGHQVVTRKSPVIDLGDDMTAFMRELHLVPKWGEDGTNTRLKQQVHRFATCRIAVVSPGKPYRNYSIADELDEYWQFIQPNEHGVWKTTMTLTQNAYLEFLNTRVPCNMSTLFALKKSALALDIYHWLCLRLFRMKEPSKLIPYKLLALQFGSSYARLRDFRLYFIRELVRVLDEYRAARVEISENGVILFPSAPHVRELSSADE